MPVPRAVGKAREMISSRRGDGLRAERLPIGFRRVKFRNFAGLRRRGFGFCPP